MWPRILAEIEMFLSIRSKIAVKATSFSAIWATYAELSAEISFRLKLAWDTWLHTSFQAIAVLQNGTIIWGTSSLGTTYPVIFSLSESSSNVLLPVENHQIRMRAYHFSFDGISKESLEKQLSIFWYNFL